ncbi:MAG: hypothetical protein IPN92_19530 [Chromatiaceae bacterium]|nr:hypothetical protein [Chromatiaceae bacterium]
MELLIADITGIQPYIFGSNRLRENIGASYLVDQATGPWARQAVLALTGAHCNVRAGQGQFELDPDWSLRDQGAACAQGIEVIYNGGGNFLGLFGNTDLARRFERTLSLRLLTEAPGLELVCAVHPFSPSASGFAVALDELFAALAKTKQGRPRRAPLGGLGVTQACRSTGNPAVAEHVLHAQDGSADRRPVSAEILAKLAVVEDKPSPVEARLASAIGIDMGEFTFPRDFADLGATKGEHSYLAVVHADGDGMGRRLRTVAKTAADAWAGIRALRDFSVAVNQAGERTLRDIVARVKGAVIWDKGVPWIRHPDPELSELGFRLAAETGSDDDRTGRWFLPLRPLVYGGDDITLVADGRIGLDLAAYGLDAFAGHTDNLPGRGGPISASAGVAIGKSSRPFARAYGLAEELCISAKAYRRERELITGCLDWHFASSSPGGTLAELREREYGVTFSQGRETLLLRPVTVRPNPRDTGRGWPTVRSAIDVFQGESWMDRRNKVKAMRDALRGGPEAVQWLRARYLDGAELPALIDARGNWARDGWDSRRCGYFDAIELFDRFIPLA